MASTSGKGISFLVEAMILLFFLTSVVNDIHDQVQGINDSITGATIVKSLAVFVLLIAVVMQLFNASGISSK